MITQISLTRIIFVFGLQPIFLIFFLYIVYLILKRKITNTIKLLLVFYILISIGLVFNIIAVVITFTEIEWISSLAYLIVNFLLLSPPIFLVLFLIKLLTNPVEFSKKRQNIYLFLYYIGTFLILIIPGGFTVNESTNWAPSFSWGFLIIIYIHFSCFITIPTIVNLFKLLKVFEDKILRRRLLMFFYGVIGAVIGIYGATLYNTWNDPAYRLIWSLVQLFLIPTSSLLMYFGVGKNL